MTPLFAYRLRPLSPLHLGTGRAEDLADIDELPRSDTIAAALLSVWRHIDPAADIGGLAAAPPFAISSALPSLQTPRGSWDVLLPLPVGLTDRLTAEGANRKQWRRARFVEQSMLRSMLAGHVPDSAVRSGSLLPRSLADRWSELWTNESRLRLAVNRLGDGPIEGLLYDFGAVYFHPEVRLSVVATFEEANVRPRFEAALHLLCDEGLGADRSAGYGRLEMEACEPFAVSLGSGMRLSLSLLHAAEAEVRGGLLDPPAMYDLVIRDGWVTAPGARTLRKRSVRMLGEGSVIRDLGTDTCYGDSPEVLDARPQLGLHHRVHRPGIAVTLPISWKP